MTSSLQTSFMLYVVFLGLLPKSNCRCSIVLSKLLSAPVAYHALSIGVNDQYSATYREWPMLPISTYLYTICRIRRSLHHEMAGPSDFSDRILMPSSFEDMLVRERARGSFPIHNNSMLPISAITEKKAATPRYQSNPTLSIHTGTKKGCCKAPRLPWTLTRDP